MAKLVIFGAGDIARLAYYYFTHDSDHKVVAFTVDREYRDNDELLGAPVVGFEEVADRYPPDRHQMFVALSYAKMNQVRARKCREAKQLKYRLANYVSSRCSYLSEHPPGENCFILEDNTIQPFVRIGRDVTLWSGNHIGHDSTIDDHCFITSHVVVSGNCHIGSYCFLGVNATLRNSLKLASGTLVGAGAVLMEDTSEGDVFVPQKARRLDRKSYEIDL